MENQKEKSITKKPEISVQKILAIIAGAFCMVVVLGTFLFLIFNAMHKPGSITTIDGVEYQLEYDNNLFSSGTYTIVGVSADADPSEVVFRSSCNGHVVNKIGDNAFKDETNLTSLTIPACITTFGTNVFSGCTSLTQIVVEDGNSSFKSIDGNLYSYDGTKLIQYAIGKTATSFTVPDGVTSIANSAFRDCTYLESVTISDKVSSIGSYIFYNCTSLKTVDLPESLSSVGSYMFYGCTSLTSVSLYDGISIIDEYAFYNCSALSAITIPETVTSIGAYAFYNCKLFTTITIPEEVSSIGNYAFYNCTALTEINYNAETASDLLLDNYLFYNAGQDGEGITVTIGSAVTKIPSYLFCSHTATDSSNNVTYYSPNIISVSFADGSVCRSIGTYAFCGCKTLENITLCDSIVVLGASAFRSCSSLESLILPANITSIGTDVVTGCSSLNIYYNGTASEWSEISGTTNITITVYTYAASGSTTEVGDYWYYDGNNIVTWSIEAKTE